MCVSFVSVCDLADGRVSMQFKFAADTMLEKAVSTPGLEFSMIFAS